jgi:hypothetical protein
VTIVAQAKVVSYHDQHLEDDFIPLIMKTFGCLHQEANDFFHRCANMAWLVKGSKGPPLSILRSFYIGRGCQWLFKKFRLPISCDK